MKKIGIVALIAMVLLTGCDSEPKENSNQKVTYEAVHTSVEKYTEPIAINYSEFEQKVANKDSFILLMWQTGCGHCQTFEPILNKVIKDYNLVIYSINLTEVSDADYAKLQNKTFVTGTPTTVAIQNGVTQSKKLVGSKDAETVIEFLVKYNYLKEVK